MKFLLIQNSRHEDFVYLENYLLVNKQNYHLLPAFETPNFPSSGSFDALIIGGAPQSVLNYKNYDYLILEKIFIEKVINEGKPILGLCFGAQFLSFILGGEVKKNHVPEIGFYDIHLTDDGQKSPLFKGFPENFKTFQWHGDTFSIPEGALHLAESNDCKNQAFQLRNVFGLQFHTEIDKHEAEKWLSAFKGDLSEINKSNDNIISESADDWQIQKKLTYKLMDNFISYIQNNS